MGNEDPSWRILGLLAVTLGLPYLLLSATSPMLQAWYARTHERARALPVVRAFERRLDAGAAELSGAGGTGIFDAASGVGMVGGVSRVCGVMRRCGLDVAWRSRGGTARRRDRILADEARPGWKLQLMWLALAACASTLLLAVTNHLTQNVASIPFLWILPLALYLLSFILCFEGRGWYHRSTFLKLAAVSLGGMAYALSEDSCNLKLRITDSVVLGRAVCVLHGVPRRTGAAETAHRHLTSFYLMVSVGGAVGGMLVGLVAPHFFSGFFELPIALGVVRGADRSGAAAGELGNRQPLAGAGGLGRLDGGDARARRVSGLRDPRFPRGFALAGA